MNRKVLKIERYSSVTLHVRPKNPISREKLKIISTKIQFSPQKFFTEWFCHKPIEPICFWKFFMKNELKLMFPKKCGFRTRKGSNIWTLFLGRSTMVLGRSTMLLERSTMAMEGLVCSRAFQKHITLRGQRHRITPLIKDPPGPPKGPPYRGLGG